MNYIEIINHFWQTQRAVTFTPNEAFLYLFLVQECNIRGWVNPFECSNGLICGSINMSEKTLIDVRNRLQQKGMISFESGQRKKKSPVYKILYCKKESINVSTSVSNSVGKNVSTTVNHILKLKETETKEIEIEKKAELNYPFSSSLFFEKWNLLASSPKWKVKAIPSLQIALDGLKKFDEAFVIEMIDQAIVGDWSVFKGVELSEQYTKWKNQKEKPAKVSKKSNEEKLSFDLFWNLYDKKVGKREKLEKKWNSLNPTTQNEILEYVPRYVKSVPDKQFRKNPETFLNNDGWKDEIVEISEKPKGKPLIDIKTIEGFKDAQERKEKAKVLSKEIQQSVSERIKKEHPELESRDFITLWDKAWKAEFIAECEKAGIDKSIYNQFFF